MGGADLGSIASHAKVEVFALCDVDANVRALKAGHAYGETAEIFPISPPLATTGMPTMMPSELDMMSASAAGTTASARSILAIRKAVPPAARCSCRASPPTCRWT